MQLSKLKWLLKTDSFSNGTHDLQMEMYFHVPKQPATYILT